MLASFYPAQLRNPVKLTTQALVQRLLQFFPVFTIHKHKLLNNEHRLYCISLHLYSSNGFAHRRNKDGTYESYVRLTSPEDFWL